jgi:hypothetical protein
MSIADQTPASDASKGEQRDLGSAGLRALRFLPMVLWGMAATTGGRQPFSSNGSLVESKQNIHPVGCDRKPS